MKNLRFPLPAHPIQLPQLISCEKKKAKFTKGFTINSNVYTQHRTDESGGDTLLASPLIDNKVKDNFDS